jgi:hypothetical protein
MSRPAHRVVLVLLFAAFCSGPITSEASCQKKNEAFWKMEQTVLDILAGKNAEQAKGFIANGARVVCGDRSERLNAVVAGDTSSVSLADTSYHGIEINAATNASEDMGFILLKMQTHEKKVRFHTIVFEKDSAGTYNIRVWHAGGWSEKTPRD